MEATNNMGTYSQIYIQIVFAVQNRRCLIESDWEDSLYQYITGIITNKGQKLLAINGMPDHIHIFIRLRPTCCLSDLVREIKKSSNQFINENKLSMAKFNWQEGFGAFSYNQRQVKMICNYVMNQKNHHKKKTFKEEYIGLLEEFEIDYNEKYTFEWLYE